MYKKILESIVEKESERVIREKFDGKNFYSVSRNTRLTQDECGFIKFKTCVFAYYDDESKLPDIYDLRGLIHQSGEITFIAIEKRYCGCIMQYNTDTKELECIV